MCAVWEGDGDGSDLGNPGSPGLEEDCEGSRCGGAHEEFELDILAVCFPNAMGRGGALEEFRAGLSWSPLKGRGAHVNWRGTVMDPLVFRDLGGRQRLILEALT